MIRQLSCRAVRSTHALPELPFPATIPGVDQILDLTIAVAKIRGDPGYFDPILQAALDGPRPTGT